MLGENVYFVSGAIHKKLKISWFMQLCLPKFCNSLHSTDNYQSSHFLLSYESKSHQLARQPRTFSLLSHSCLLRTGKKINIIRILLILKIKRYLMIDQLKFYFYQSIRFFCMYGCKLAKYQKNV